MNADGNASLKCVRALYASLCFRSTKYFFGQRCIISFNHFEDCGADVIGMNASSNGSHECVRALCECAYVIPCMRALCVSESIVVRACSYVCIRCVCAYVFQRYISARLFTQ